MYILTLLAEFAFGMIVAVVMAAFVLRWRDGSAQKQGKRREQIQAQLDAILEFRKVMERSAPGVLLIIMGAFFTVDRARQHEPDWWQLLVFIPLGWLLVWWLARKSWRRYQALQKLANKSEYDYSVEVPAEFKGRNLG